jgi:hypothetical protein
MRFHFLIDGLEGFVEATSAEAAISKARYRYVADRANVVKNTPAWRAALLDIQQVPVKVTFVS